MQQSFKVKVSFHPIAHNTALRYSNPIFSKFAQDVTGSPKFTILLKIFQKAKFFTLINSLKVTSLTFVTISVIGKLTLCQR